MPCSGTGTLARNPEIRLRLQPEDLARQAERQRAILRGALKRLAPGGRLVYSTCSLEPEENERVVEAVAGEELRRVSMEPLIAQVGGEGRAAAGGQCEADWYGGEGWRAADAAGGAWVRWLFRGAVGARITGCNIQLRMNGKADLRG